MAFGDLFRPKYKHSKSEVRAAAVADMDKDDIDLLIEVASKDQDSGIRRTAIGKISDPETLAGLADSQEDPKLRDYANSLAIEIWIAKAINADDEPVAEENFLLAFKYGGDRVIAEVAGHSKHSGVRRLALSKIDDDKVLGQVVRKSQRMEEWQLAIDRISDESVLRGIAIDETRKQIAFAALERITEGEILEEIASKAKSKPVRAKAKRAKAAMLKAAPTKASKISDEEKQRRAERSQVVRNIEKLAAGDEWIESRILADEALAQWEELGEDDNTKQGKRFHKALARFNKNHEQFGQAARQAQRRVEQEVQEEERRTAAAAEAKLRAEAAAESQASGSEPVANTDGDNAALDTTALDTAPPKKREAVLDEGERDRRLDNQEELERLCESLDEILETKEIRGVDRTLKEIDRGRRKINALPKLVAESLAARYDEARRKAVIYLGDLREADDWKRWTTVPKMEALVEIAKELLADETSKKLGETLKKLQREWRELGPAPREKGDELWKVFKSTCDEIYERVKGERAVREVEQNENLEKKEALCERAEELKNSTDWAASGELFKEMQTAWKSIGPVPRKKSDSQWKRFRAACDFFFEARAPQLEERFAEESDNLEAKQALIKEIEVLAATAAGVEEVEAQIQEVRSMQRRWRELGKVAHKEYAPLAEAYKTACDEVYGKREVIAEAAREADRAIIVDIEKRIAECADAGWDSDAEDIAKQVLAIRTSYLELDKSLEGREELGAKVDGLIRSQLESEPAAYAGTVLDPKRSSEAREKLIAQAEELVPKQEEEDGDKSPEEMAESLRAALADRALGGVLSKDEDRSVEEIVAELREAWALIPPVPGALGSVSEKQFNVLCDQLLAASNSPTPVGSDDS